VLFQCDDKFAKDYCRAEDDLREFLRGEGRDVRGYDKAQALVTLNVMRQLAGMAKINPTISHVKNVLDNIDGGVFVVAEHSEVIDRLALGLSKYDPVVINGSTSKKGREEAVDAFTNGDSRVMVGQVKAAGVGLTLHGGGINHRVVIAQLPWNPSDLLQAEDRLYRHGQTKDVDIEVCLSAIDGRWTIDERLWGRLEAKQFDTEMILDGEGSYLLYDPTDDILDSYRD
jgi:superfamily II DNA/RNA helicase